MAPIKRALPQGVEDSDAESAGHWREETGGVDAHWSFSRRLRSSRIASRSSGVERRDDSAAERQATARAAKDPVHQLAHELGAVLLRRFDRAVHLRSD